MNIVLDASVAVKWFFTDETSSAEALSILESLIHNPDSFFVPDLFFIETSAVILRKSKDAIFANDCLSKIYALGLRALPTTGTTLSQAVLLSQQLSITVYDGIYVATAQQCEAKWLTADRKATKKLNTNLFLSL